MSTMKRIAGDLARAALQLTLPFLETLQPPQVSKVGARLARLNGSFVEYELRRSRRRTIGFVIDDRGLSVTAPLRVSQVQVEAALQERADWVLRKLVEWRDYAARRERFAVRWQDGSTFPFLGSAVTMRVDPAHRGAPALEDDVLRLALPPHACEEQLRDSVHAWIQKRARAHFHERLGHFEREHGVAPSKWSLSSARTRWGSCGADGTIRLNWRLMHFPGHVVDYVIAHELAHLRELNHGPHFWRAVGELFPEYRQARDWLRAFPDDHPVA
jgi:predicted metal-dependent hydrolase